jgi:palmitoyltransferase
MGIVRTVAVIVLVISFFTFVAFFGRLPVLRYVPNLESSSMSYQKLILRRNTPIGGLHRVIWLHIPSGFRAVDQKVTQGRLSAWIMKVAHTLWNDRHPVIMVRVSAVSHVRICDFVESRVLPQGS